MLTFAAPETLIFRAEGVTLRLLPCRSEFQDPENWSATRRISSGARGGGVPYKCCSA